MSYEDYTFLEKIGSGGNGVVYLAKDLSGENVAIKVSKNKNAYTKDNEINKKKLRRFEIEAQKGYELTTAGQRGLIPIKHFELPCPKSGEYFFVMPIATPLEEKIKSINKLNDLIDIFKELALTLVELHAQEISHRDIKPDNILYYDGAYCLSDLGLMDFPEKEKLTLEKETLGNRKTMAPEMRVPRETDDHRPADVYSFAKTLWMILTKEEFAFDGQFNPFENQKLQRKYPQRHFVELYQLLIEATYEDPSKRPTMSDFLARFNQWIEIAQDRRKAEKSAWHYIENSVIRQFSPSTVIWRDSVQIVEILQKLAVLDFNHTFLPTGGGMDMVQIEEASWLKEPNLLALRFQFNIVHIFKLKRLVWELPNNDPRFSYFRLEFDTLNPIFPEGVKALEEWKAKEYNSTEKECNEDLNVNSKGEYEVYNPDNENAVQVTRWFNSVFLIVFKAALYNEGINATYDGRHAAFNTDDFREYMEILQSVYTHPILNSYFSSIAEEDPFNDGHLEDIKEVLLMSEEEIEAALHEITKPNIAQNTQELKHLGVAKPVV